MIKNERGLLTIDLIFALVLVLSMTLLLGVFSYTLSVIEGIQYLTFSSSRAYFAGDQTPEKQKQAAEDKFNTLSKTGAYKNFLRKDWFDVSIDGIDNFKKTYSSTTPKDIFEGVRTKVVVGLLSINIPIFGSTEGDSPYEAFVTSFLGREPSSEECMSFVKQRYDQIMRTAGIPANANAYVAFDDNGC